MKIKPIMPTHPLKNPPKWRAQVSLRFEHEVIVDSVTKERFEIKAGESKAKFDEIQGRIYDTHA